MWETIGAIGTLAGGLGALAGGLGIGGSEGPSVNDYGQTIDERWLRTMQNAERYQVSPLTALGVNPGGFRPPQKVGGKDWSKIGQGLSEALRAPMQARLARIKLAQEKQRLDNMGLQNVGLRKRLQDMDTTTGPPGSGITESKLPLQHPAYASGDQRGSSVQALEQLYRDEAGIIHAMPAEGAQDYMSESAIANVPYQFKKLWRQLFTPAAALSAKKITRLRDHLDDMEGFMRQNNKLRPDEYLTYDSNQGLPRVKRYTGGSKKLFFKRNPTYRQQPGRYGGLQFRRNYR